MDKTFEFTPDNEKRTVETLFPQGEYRACVKDKWGTITLKIPHMVDTVEMWEDGSWRRKDVLWDTLRPVPPTFKSPGFIKRLWWKCFRRNRLPVARLVSSD